MMRKKHWQYLILATLVLLAASACSNDGGANRDMEQAASNGFKTSIFLGDSITEGLSYHDVLDEENVLAGAGKTAQIAFETGNVDELADRNPEHVYIQLGSDDILWPTDNPMEHSLTYYGKLIEEIQSKLPDTTITLLTVTPVTLEAEKKEPRYQNIAEFNEKLQELAAEKQLGYVDLTPFVDDHTKLYDTDGIHFQEAFYPLLLDYVKDQSELQQRR